MRNIKVKLLVDSGASVNVITRKHFEDLKKTGVELSETNTKLFTYQSKTCIKLLGMFKTVVEYNGESVEAKFYVT